MAWTLLPVSHCHSENPHKTFPSALMLNPPCSTHFASCHADDEHVRPEDELVSVGAVSAVIDGVVVVHAHGKCPPIGEGTVLCLKQPRVAVGRVEVRTSHTCHDVAFRD